MNSLKKEVLINKDDINNIKIYNINEDKFYDLNETASIIFENIDKSNADIMNIIKKIYQITDEFELENDIKNIKDYVLLNFYEK